MRYKDGFSIITCLEQDGLIHRAAATVEIAKGDALHDDGAGLATNATTAFANTFLGIAAAALDNSPAVTGAEVAIIPPRPSYKFIVPNGGTTLAATTDVGTLVDLQAAGTVDSTDNTCISWGFFVDSIDVSTEAVAANAKGYLIGRFRPTADES